MSPESPHPNLGSWQKFLYNVPMRYRLASLGLLLLCAGCLPKKTPEGEWTATLWSLPVKINFAGGKTTVHSTYRDAPVTAVGDYTFSDKDGGSEFDFNISDVQIKHGNPYTQQMLSDEIQRVVAPRSFKGYVKFEKPNEMDYVMDSGGGQESHIIFTKVIPK